MRLYDLLPEIYKDDETEKLFDILQIAIDELEASTEDVKNLYDVDKVREDFLINLASNLGVDVDRYSPLDTRTKIAKAIDLHRLKGTKKAIELLSELLLSEVKITEWFEYGGEPYKFKVYINSIKSEDLYQKIVNLINEYKNERSWLESIGLHSESKSKVNVGFALKEGKKYDIPVYFDIPNLRNNIYQATAYRVAKSTAVGVSKISINTQPNNIYQATAYRVARTISIYPM